MSAIGVGKSFPVGIKVDLIQSSSATKPCDLNEEIDIGNALLKQKSIIFGVPGAFTPTCSAQHLPGFIRLADEIHSKGIDSIYCLSVNDKHVMRAWGQHTEGSHKIKLVADGNGEYSSALGLIKDAIGSRMGLRCKRFAAIVDDGKVIHLAVDEKGMESTSAESILKLL